MKAEGWGKYPDGEGRSYYFNVNTGVTSWTPPEGWVDEDEPKNEEPATVSNTASATIATSENISSDANPHGFSNVVKRARQSVITMFSGNTNLLSKAASSLEAPTVK